MRHFRYPVTVVAIAVGLLAASVGAAHALPQDDQQATELRRRVTQLEAAIEALRSDYDARLTAIEQQLAELGGGQKEATTDEVMSAEERADLERELAAILGDPVGSAAAPQAPGQGSQRFASQTRNLNRLNPEISATGDLSARFADRTGDPEANQFRFNEFEVALQAPLDPYSAAKFFIVQEGGEFELEEGYIEYNALPGGIGVKAGEMRLDFGKLNRWHQHALPQADRPLVHQAVWGEEGLRGLGVTLSWLPRPFLGDYNEIIVQVTNDSNDVAFSGRGFDQPVVLVHASNYVDLSDASYLEIGLSAATGTNDFAGDFRTQVYGTDWNFNWVPPAASLYRGFELRGELLYQRRDGPDGNVGSLGVYTYGVFKINRRSYVGLRGDWTELPDELNASLWGASPYFEWWQSEWARFRLQYSYASRRLRQPEPEHKFYIQLTWSLGPHKHDKY